MGCHHWRVVFSNHSCLKSLATGSCVEGMIKITIQSESSDQTEIKLMLFLKDMPRPLLASVNEQNKPDTVEIAPVAICSKIKAKNKVVVQKSDPNEGFSFIALTDFEEEGTAVELFKFIPNFKR